MGGWDATSTDQRWQLRPDGFIESLLSPGKCIDVDGLPGIRDGSALQLWDCEFSYSWSNKSDQRWLCSQAANSPLPMELTQSTRQELIADYEFNGRDLHTASGRSRIQHIFQEHFSA